MKPTNESAEIIRKDIIDTFEKNKEKGYDDADILFFFYMGWIATAKTALVGSRFDADMIDAIRDNIAEIYSDIENFIAENKK